MEPHLDPEPPELLNVGAELVVRRLLEKEGPRVPQATSDPQGLARHLQEERRERARHLRPGARQGEDVMQRPIARLCKVKPVR